MLQVLKPDVKHSEFPSLVPFAKRFPNFLQHSKIQLLDDKWRRLAIVSLPFEHEDMEFEEFWERFRNFGINCVILSLP